MIKIYIKQNVSITQKLPPVNFKHQDLFENKLGQAYLIKKALSFLTDRQTDRQISLLHPVYFFYNMVISYIYNIYNFR